MNTRCGWAGDDADYIRYHDEEWGVPVYDDRKLFEMLLLEGAQAGLSWITILKRRENYRRAYDGFDPVKIAKWSEAKIAKLLQDEGIIRNKLKVRAAKQNAIAYLQVLEEYDSFSDFIWSFVDHKVIVNSWASLAEMPAETEQSRVMSKALKKRGFKFVGPTICYAYMQSVGMVNDHIISCFRYEEVR